MSVKFYVGCSLVQVTTDDSDGYSNHNSYTAIKP